MNCLPCLIRYKEIVCVAMCELQCTEQQTNMKLCLNIKETVSSNKNFPLKTNEKHFVLNLKTTRECFLVMNADWKRKQQHRTVIFDGTVNALNRINC